MGHACHLCYLVFQGDLLVPFRACSHGAVVLETTQSGPQQLPSPHQLRVNPRVLIDHIHRLLLKVSQVGSYSVLFNSG